MALSERFRDYKVGGVRGRKILDGSLGSTKIPLLHHIDRN